MVGSLMKKWMGTCFMATAQGFGWTLGAVQCLQQAVMSNRAMQVPTNNKMEPNSSCDAPQDMANNMVNDARAELARKWN